MTIHDAAIQLKSLREQLNVLEAKLRAGPAPARPRTLADLRGVLQSESQSTEGEIDAALCAGDDATHR